MKRELPEHIKIERSIITTYRKTIFNAFVGAVKEYELISEGDRIAVCISGGKDSMLMAKCFQLLQRHSDVPFELKFIVMDPGYLPQNRALILENAKKMDIPIDVFESPVFDVVDNAGGSPCYLCARMRRGYLYARASELGCNKIALGHHMNDMIETLLMSMMYASEIKTMMPKLRSTNFEGMELIRPLYKVKEDRIIAWAEYNNLKFLRCACHFTEQSEHHEGLSKRLEIKELIKNAKRDNPNVEDNLFKSAHNVNLATIVGFREADKKELRSFLEDY